MSVGDIGRNDNDTEPTLSFLKPPCTSTIVMVGSWNIDGVLIRPPTWSHESPWFLTHLNKGLDEFFRCPNKWLTEIPVDCMTSTISSRREASDSELFISIFAVIMEAW